MSKKAKKTAKSKKHEPISDYKMKIIIDIALSSYATHKDYSAEEWLKVQELKRTHPDVKARYKHLMNSIK